MACHPSTQLRMTGEWCQAEQGRSLTKSLLKRTAGHPSTCLPARQAQLRMTGGGAGRQLEA